MQRWLKWGLWGILAGIILNVLLIATNLTGLVPSPYIAGFISENFMPHGQIVSVSDFSISLILFVFQLLEVAVYWFIIGIIFQKLNEKRKEADKKWLYWLLLILLGALILAIILFSLNPRLTSVQQISNETLNEINNLYKNTSIISAEGGACVIQDNATSEKTCILTLNESCSGTFNKGLLCTAEQLGTNCAPSRNHRGIDDGEYFIDTCGNQANPYDESQVNNKAYWVYLVR